MKHWGTEAMEIAGPSIARSLWIPPPRPPPPSLASLRSPPPPPPATPNPTPFNFLGLPKKVHTRFFEIYFKDLFDVDGHCCKEYVVNSDVAALGQLSHHEWSPIENRLALLRVNKKINKRAKKVLYRVCSFRIELRQEDKRGRDFGAHKHTDPLLHPSAKWPPMDCVQNLTLIINIRDPEPFVLLKRRYLSRLRRQHGFSKTTVVTTEMHKQITQLEMERFCDYVEKFTNLRILWIAFCPEDFNDRIDYDYMMSLIRPFGRVQVSRGEKSAYISMAAPYETSSFMCNRTFSERCEIMEDISKEKDERKPRQSSNLKKMDCIMFYID